MLEMAFSFVAVAYVQPVLTQDVRDPLLVLSRTARSIIPCLRRLRMTCTSCIGDESRTGAGQR